MTTEAADVEFFFPSFIHWTLEVSELLSARNIQKHSNEKAATCGTVRESQPKQGL